MLKSQTNRCRTSHEYNPLPSILRVIPLDNSVFLSGYMYIYIYIYVCITRPDIWLNVVGVLRHTSAPHLPHPIQLTPCCHISKFYHRLHISNHNKKQRIQLSDILPHDSLKKITTIKRSFGHEATYHQARSRKKTHSTNTKLCQHH
jgi:hypothetical protein